MTAWQADHEKHLYSAGAALVSKAGKGLINREHDGQHPLLMAAAGNRIKVGTAGGVGILHRGIITCCGIAWQGA